MSDTQEPIAPARTIAELEKDPAGIVKRWIAELDMADEEEREWRKETKGLHARYAAEAKEAEGNSRFNILYSNTETIEPAVFNSTPEPDVRRRFRDKDIVGKYASMVMERALSYQIDTDDYNCSLEDSVHDACIGGRGVARIKYVPTVVPMEAPIPEGQVSEQVINDAEPEQKVGVGEPSPDEEIVDEDVPIEYVAWDKFRHGRAKRWADVPWVSFEHDMTKDQAIEFFGPETAEVIPFEEKVPGEDENKDADPKRVFRIAQVFEIWDKDQRRVLFISRKVKERPLLVRDDPLEVPGFFPTPRPMYAIKNTQSLVPVPPYRQYQRQAQELDRLTLRINKMVEALKVRGAYSAVSKEIQGIMDAADLEMIPVSASAEIAQMGGLDNAIWLMPVQQLASTLRELYAAREQTIQVIYQISGVSDVMRGATDPNETLGAQQLKSKWGGLRLDRFKRDVQRFIRDLMRLQADVIASKFQPETLEQMTQIDLPTQEEQEMAMQQAKALAAQVQAGSQMMQQAQVSQVPPDPALQQNLQAMQQQLQQLQESPVLKLPSWEVVMGVLRNDLQRCYRIDIETDSTVAETVERDMAEMRETLTAIGEFITAATPTVQAGQLPMEAVKDVCLALARHSKMGRQVEDALEQLQAPAPGPGPDELQQAMQALMQQISAPKRFVGQAGPDGRIQGVVGE